MTNYEEPMRWLFGCLIAAGIAVGLIIGAILWWLSR
jgi:hypothetical protein